MRYFDFSGFSNEAFAAYLGGFTDGEGHIGIDLKHGGVRITLANTVKAVIGGIRHRLGFGTIRSQKQREHWKRKYTLVFDDAIECERFLEIVRPYLHIKAVPADVLLARCAAWRGLIAAANERNRLIREAIARGEIQKHIAIRFKVSTQTVSRIKLGHTWASEKPKTFRGLGTLQGKVKHHRSLLDLPRP